MKTILTILLFPAFVSGIHAQPQKRALLIAVGFYTDAVSYPGLAVANGIPLLQKTLSQRGFTSDNIYTLIDAQATRPAVLDAIRQQLIEKATKDDIVILHFTGHGKNVADDNGDELDTEDEAIVTHEGLLIRDDDLSKLLREIRLKVGAGGQLLVLLDACHSGTGTRAEGRRVKRAPWRTHFKRISRDQTMEAPMIAFFASQSFEPSFQMAGIDGRPYGPLTYAFCQALEGAGPSISYRGLFDQIAWIISLGNKWRHTPQAEGELDLQVFGGRMPAPLPYFKSKLVLGPEHALIDAGLLKGLNPGTELVLYPVDTRDTFKVKPLARGRLEKESQASLFESIIKFDRPVTKAVVEQGWFFIRQRQFNGYELHVTTRIANPWIREKVREMLAGIPAVRQDRTDSMDLQVVQTSGNGKLVLMTPDSTKLFSAKISAANPEEVLAKLKELIGDFVQAQFLRELTFIDSPYRIDMTIGLGKAPPASEFHQTPVVRMKKDTVYVTVKNETAVRLYYTILDIDSRNKVTVVIPKKGWSASEFVLGPGETQTRMVKFDAVGSEVLKLIATPAPIDLRQAIENRGRDYSDRSFFETLFKHTFLERSGGRGPEDRYRGNEAGVSTAVLEVVR